MTTLFKAEYRLICQARVSKVLSLNLGTQVQGLSHKILLVPEPHILEMSCQLSGVPRILPSSAPSEILKVCREDPECAHILTMFSYLEAIELVPLVTPEGL